MSRPGPKVPTRCAHWGYDEHRFWGYRVSSDLVGKCSLMDLIVLSVLGRRLPVEYCAILEDAAAAHTMADPRIWPLKLTRLVSSYGSTIAGAAAGLTILQDAQIGPWPCARAAEDLCRLRNRMGDRHRDSAAVRREVEQYLGEHKIVWGFGTPFRSRDERLLAFRASIEMRQRHELPYWRLMDTVASAMREIKGIEPNIVFGVAAACLDMDLTPLEIGPISTMLMQHMFWANAVEGAEQAPSCLRELPSGSVVYVGAPRRSLPERPIGCGVVAHESQGDVSSALETEVG